MWVCKSYFDCHIHVHTIVSRWIHPEVGGCGDNQWTCVSEQHRDGEGVGFQELSRLSLDTHRREVTGAYGTEKPLSIEKKKQRACSS